MRIVHTTISKIQNTFQIKFQVFFNNQKYILMNLHLKSELSQFYSPRVLSKFIKNFIR